MSSEVDHPQHYRADTGYEAIDVIEAWGLGFCLGNTVKYISRAGRKDREKEIQDLEKAQWYLARHITRLRSSREVAVDVELADCLTEGAFDERDSTLPTFLQHGDSRQSGAIESEVFIDKRAT
ncbi:MAG: DUF3310 domain-containing protein [Oxalobacteraceae bacterium]|nr:DUF3310 domain-containing protein [Oxalobacteraceae bacterium]